MKRLIDSLLAFAVMIVVPSMALAAGTYENETLKAETTLNGKNGHKLEKSESTTNDALLQTAYTDLTTADHDYDGHRVAAAKNVKDFAKKHKITLKEGERASGEKQAVSDAKLRDALAKLEQVVGNGKTGEGITKHEAKVETKEAGEKIGKGDKDRAADIVKHEEEAQKEHDKHLIAAITEIKAALHVK